MNPNVLRIFIGFDPVESVAWHTMAHSIFKRSSLPVAIIPVNIDNIRTIFKRQRDPKQSNAFSFTRFLVPYLSGYSGLAAYFDCDMLLQTDISELFNIAHADLSKAVHVVQHNYEPRDDIKYLNAIQYRYPRKNWSSVILWNCAHQSNRVVTPDYVNNSSALELHRFQWLKDEEIGSLDIRWNWLVGEYDNAPMDVKNIHWTNGGPYFHEYNNTDFADEWFAENNNVNFCLQRKNF